MTFDLVDAGGTDQFGWRFEDGDMFWHDYVNNVDVIQYDRSEGAWIPADGGASLGTSANPWSSLTTEQLNTAPTGTIVGLDGDQTVANNTDTDIEWETETTKGEVSNLLNSTENKVVIPSGFSWARVCAGLRFDSLSTLIEFSDARLNGSGIAGAPVAAYRGNLATDRIWFNTGWFAVSQGDEITARVTHSTGDSEDLLDDETTFMEVWLL